ncbi:MAG: cell division protein ZapA [Proteobacteria bacterium]|nr:cell division protein ZapA [Pseudomonadota bacterium]MBU1740344.1 cell division protein ZapA [Pseudomonadota bacterium]
MGDTLVKIEILGQAHTIRTDEAEERVLEVVDYLNTKIAEVSAATRTTAKLNVAILAALNITHEYLLVREERDQLLKGVQERSRKLLAKLERDVPQRSAASSLEKPA